MAGRLRFNTARELFEAFPEAEDDISADPTDDDPVSYLRKLAQSGTPENAITFCAYLLPRREAVWWGHQCLHRLPQALEAPDHVYLQLAEDWVREPEEERRRAALDAGTAARPKSPAAWIALAAGWSGGSMLGADAAAVPPPPYLTAKGVNAGVLSSLARIDQQERAASLRTFVEMGIHLLTQE